MDINSTMSADQAPTIHLLPAPIPTGGHALWSESGRTILSTLSPASNNIAAWVAPKADSTARAWVDENGIQREEVPLRVGKSYDQDKAIYMGSWGSADNSLHEVSPRNVDETTLTLPFLNSLDGRRSSTRTPLRSSPRLKQFIKFTLRL